ncbi:reticulon-1-like isoform X1 [Synchiropus splendidus]|uniref:reticulon-1-like isoform X1 n=1 Tax=Synchiropus splendidus TaxID=270530 RepID=UPI00237D81B3|nr:reticulon-1-like isoform X1 [Synchiropus splendidus]
MADDEQQVSSTVLLNEQVHHYQPEPESEQAGPDIFSADDIVDLVGGARDALERHLAEEDKPPGEFSEEPVTSLDPEPEQPQPAAPIVSESSRLEAEPEAARARAALPAAEARTEAPASPPAEARPAETAEPAAPVLGTFSPSAPSPSLMNFSTAPGQVGLPPAPVSPLSPLHSPDSLEDLSLTESPNQPQPPSFGHAGLSWEGETGLSPKQDPLAAPYLSLGQDTAVHNPCEDSGISFSPDENLASSARSSSVVAPQSLTKSADRWDLPSDFTPDLQEPEEEEVQNNNPFDGFSPLADSGYSNFGVTTTNVASDSPDLVQSQQNREPEEADQTPKGSELRRGSLPDDDDDEDDDEDDDLRPSLPDILKSSPLNPDKLDSGSSEGSPEEQSPVLERRMMESPNPPINLSINPFMFESKVSLLKEMTEEMEGKASIQEPASKDPPPTEVQEQLKSVQEDWFSSQQKAESPGVPRKLAEESDSESPSADSLSPVLEAMAKNPACFQMDQEDTLPKVSEETSLKNRMQDEAEVADEASEHEVSSEEFEFIERPPKGVLDEFLEALDSPKNTEVSSRAAEPSLSVAAQRDETSYLLLSQSAVPLKSKVDLDSQAPCDPPPAPVLSSAPHLAPTAGVKAELQRNNGEAGTKGQRPSVKAVVDLLYWRDVRTSGWVFGALLLVLLSLTACSIISVVSYVGLALLSVTICFRVYKGVLQAVHKSDEGHPFRQYIDQEVALSEELVHRYSDALLTHLNHGILELRRLFLVQDLVDSLKAALILWILTYVGSWFNGLTLGILGVMAAFSFPVVYEKHQAQIDHYVALVNNHVQDVVAKIQAAVPGLKRKAE